MHGVFFTNRYGNVYICSYERDTIMDSARNFVYALAKADSGMEVTIAYGWYEREVQKITALETSVVGFAMATVVEFDGVPITHMFPVTIFKALDEEKAPFYLFEVGASHE